MNQEKWLYTGVEEGGVVLHDHRYRKLHISGKKVKIVQVVGAALLLCLFCRIYLGEILFPARNRIEATKSVPLPCRGEMICDFNDITPSEKLEWHPCFNTAQCARLTVPMDYNRPLNVSKDNPKVHIALVMITAPRHIRTGKYSESPLLINPGGPGGSGAFFALGIGSKLQSIVSRDNSRDIIGFDPRGIGATTPQADCWTDPHPGNDATGEAVRTGAFDQMIWTVMGIDIPLVNETESALAQRDARARATAKLCKRHDDVIGEDSILRHMSTPAVAHDMLSIVDAWDEWRAETGKVDTSGERLWEWSHMLQMPSIRWLLQDFTMTADHEAPDEKPYRLDTKGKLVYWGFSYGTLLGATFAAMFPQRVGRVLLDGVVDADRYVSPTWAESLRDTDLVEEKFYHYCQKAGPRCALYRPNDTEADIGARVQDIFQSLKEEPFNGISPYSNLPFTMTFATLKSFMFGALYSPTLAFPVIALFLDTFHRHDEDGILSFIPTNYPSYKPFCNTKAFTRDSQDAQLAVMCSDKRYPLNETLPELRKRFDSIANTSRYADVWMSLMIGCDAYDITPTDPPMRWDDHPSHRQTPINTSYPLMFLSNTADPVTPLFAGVKMARKFVDAGLLEQQSEGHCSLAAASRCTLQKVRRYFEEGVVPARPEWGPKGQEIEGGVWDRCEADEWPWKPFDSDAWIERVERDQGWNQIEEIENEEELLALEALMEDAWDTIRLMDDWKDVQQFAKKYIRPMGMNDAPRADLW